MKTKAIITVLAAVLLAVGVIVYQRNTLPERGERAFQRLGCGGCHFSGAGPNLTHIVRRQDPKFLEEFIANPPAVYRQRRGQPLNDGYMLMPDMHATPEDAREIVAYLRELDKQ